MRTHGTTPLGRLPGLVLPLVPLLVLRALADTSCAGGHEAVNSTTDCRACAPGQFRPWNSSNPNCTLCPKKTFQSEHGQTDCSNCVRARNPGATSCSGCEAGKFGFKDESGEECEDCPAGWWAYKGDKEKCEKCPQGWHANAVLKKSEKCTSCTAGTWSDQLAAWNISTCKNCTAGTWSDQLAAWNLSTCKNCTAGSYSATLGASSDTSCVACDPGKYRIAPGAGHPLECLDCPTGKFGNDTKKLCLACPAGWHQDTRGKTKCTRCKHGATTDSQGGQAECLQCDEGKYYSNTSNDQSGVCRDCPKGFYQDAKGKRLCKQCETGKYGTSDKATNVKSCKECTQDRTTVNAAFTAQQGATNKTGNATASNCLCKTWDSYYREKLERDKNTKPAEITEQGYYVEQLHNTTSPCLDCPDNANCSSVDGQHAGLSLTQIFAKRGAWRVFWNDTIFLNCSQGYTGIGAWLKASERCCPDSQTCGRHQQVDQNASWAPPSQDDQCLCDENECYSGPMCMVCGGVRGDGYALSPFSGKCEKCAIPPSMAHALLGLGILCILVFLAVACFIRRTRLHDSGKGKSVDQFEAEKARETAERIDQFAIIISWAQILSSIPLTYDGVEWPHDFQVFARMFSIVDVDLSWMSVVQCQLAIPFLEKFMLHLATPLVIVLSVKLSHCVTTRFCRGSAKLRRTLTPKSRRALALAQRAVGDKCIFFILLMLYPGLSRQIFQVFRCHHIEGTGKFRNYSLTVLQRDFSVECGQGLHVNYTAFAAAGIVFFSVGMPVALFFELWHHRKSLHNTSHPKHRNTVRRLGFLYSSYEPSFWWWEWVTGPSRAVGPAAYAPPSHDSPRCVHGGFAPVAHRHHRPVSRPVDY